MSSYFQSYELEDQVAENRRLILGVKAALDLHHPQLLETARKEWESNFSGPDPSDACVNVQVSSGDSSRPSPPCAGVRRKRGRPLLNGGGRPLVA